MGADGHDGKPEFAYALSDQPEHKTRIVSDTALSAGKHTIRFDFAYDGGGRGKGGLGTLFVDNKKVAEGRIESTLSNRLSLDETLDVGECLEAGVRDREKAKSSETMWEITSSRPRCRDDRTVS